MQASALGGWTLESWLFDIPVAVWIGGVLALYMAWAIGANDVANAMGTSLGSGAITIGGAVVIAGIFEFAGAILAGGHVTDTVRKGMLDVEIVALNGDLLVHGMLASLAAAATLLMAATFWGPPDTPTTLGTRLICSRVMPMMRSLISDSMHSPLAS